MSVQVFLIVLAAAALHAGWNAFLKLRIEPFLAMVLVTTASGVVAAPAFLWYGPPRLEAWPALAASVVFHLIYNTSLAEAYRRADMGQVYPIARGGAPLLTAVVSVTLVGERLAPAQALGVATLGLGVMLVAVLGRRKHDAPNLPALFFAGITAASISGYTLVDAIGARASGDANAYCATLFFLDGFPMLLVAMWRRSRADFISMKPFLLQGFAGGAMSTAAYWIVIWAMTVAPIPLVAAVRETSVLFATLIAVTVLREPMQWTRAASAVLIVGALVLMRLG